MMNKKQNSAGRHLSRMDANEKYTHKILGDQEFQSYFIDKIIAEVYTEINA
jgi:hypothetical protein